MCSRGCSSLICGRRRRYDRAYLALVALLDRSRLSPDTFRLVQDARYRAHVTSELLRSDPSSSESARARDAVDAAVVEILAAAGLPRGPVNGPIVDNFNRGWFGRKVEDCRLLIDIGIFDVLPEAERGDSLVKTWIHESLHARQPYSSGFNREWREVSGYEEGMVEGLTQLLSVEGLELQPTISTYRFYVAAYRSLGAVLEIDVEPLWRELWSRPAGDVRPMFLPTVSRILREQRQQQLGRAQLARVAGFAARYFRTDRMRESPDERAMMSAWRRAIE